MHNGDGSHLLRVLGVVFGVAVVIGGTIGQGILRAPGLVASGVTIPSLIIALWVLGGVVSYIDSMSTVELASSIRRAGGPYIFTKRAFGPFVGLATGIADWLSALGSIAFVSVVFAEYLHRLGIAADIPLGVLAPTLVLAVGGIHWFGTKVGGRSLEIGSAIKAALFVVLVLALLLAPRASPVASTVLSGAVAPAMTLMGVIVAIRAIFGTYSGWNAASYFCEEVRDPAKDIAKATFTGIIVVTVIYVLVNLAYLNVLTPAEMAGSKLVAADAAARVFGPAADPVVTAISLISLITIVNSMVMTYPRVLFAVARDAEIPGLVHVADNGSPRAALLVTVVAGALLAMVGVYDLLLAFSASLLAAVGVGLNAAVIVMRRREPDLERPYRMPLFPLPAILALLVNAAMLIAFLIEDPVSAIEAFALLAMLTGVAYAIIRKRTNLADEPAAS